MENLYEIVKDEEVGQSLPKRVKEVRHGNPLAGLRI
jgi:hypothetical protein